MNIYSKEFEAISNAESRNTAAVTCGRHGEAAIFVEVC
jgi:hypothetical protein